MNIEELLTVEDLMKRFKVTRATIYNWIRKGLPSAKIEGTRRFKPDEVNKWVDKYFNNNQPQD